MDKHSKKIVMLTVAASLTVIAGVLVTTQVFGKKIVVEPSKTKILTVVKDIKEGQKITKEMLGLREIYENDCVSGVLVKGQENKIVDSKARINLTQGMQIQKLMFQDPKEQFKDGYIKVAVDLKDVKNTVANQVKVNDYVNVNIALNGNGSSNDKTLDKAVEIVLAKRKILDLVNGNGIAISKDKTNDKGEFRTRFIILELTLEDYTRYKAACMVANKESGTIELTLCDPLQTPMAENFKPDVAIQKAAQKEVNEDLETGNISLNRR